MKKIKFIAWAAWLAATLFYAYEFVLRVSPGVMATSLMHDLGASATAMGLMTSAFYYAYSGMQLPSGLLVDRFGPKKILIIGCILMTLATVGFAHTSNIQNAAFYRFIMGAAGAVGFVCCLKLVRAWFPSSFFGSLAGFTNTFGYLGATFAGAPLAILLVDFGWRQATRLTALVGILVLICIIIFVKNQPNNLSASISKESLLEPQKGLWQTFLILLKQPATWINAIIAGLLVAPTSTFADLWGVKFLQHSCQFSMTQAATATSLIYIGIAIGNPVFGLISDFMGKRRLPLIIGSLLCIISTVFIIFIQHASLTAICISCLIFGIGQGSHVINFAIAEEQCSSNIAATAISFVNMMVILGAAIFEPLVGFLMDWYHHHHSLLHDITGTHHYATEDFRFALATLIFCQVAALLLSIYGIKQVK